jgi:flagellar FliL protein
VARKKAAEGEAGKKKGGKRKLFMIAGLVVVLGAGGVVGMKMLGGSDAQAEEAPSQSEPPAEGEVLDVATLTTNVSGDANLARVGLAVVTSEGAATDMVEARYPVLKDAVVSELARTDADKLRTAEGADDLRKRLTRRAKKIYPDGEVLRVLLTEVVVQ